MRFEITPKVGIFFFLFLILVAYSAYQARFLILGPQVIIESHSDGVVVGEPLVLLEGRARNISVISLNDRQIFVDENGRWSEKLIVSKGTSIMTLKARDRLGRETEKRVQIILN